MLSLNPRYLKAATAVAVVGVMLSMFPQMGLSEDAPPKVGDVAADFELKSASGDKVKLSQVVESRPVVLVVLRGYPGYQCPACNTQVVQLLEKAEKLKAAKAQVLIVYPGPSKDLGKHADEFLKDKTIPDHFQLLLDPDFTFTKAYHLRWDAPQETAYPATFVVRKDRQITFAKISKSHGGRTKPDEILKALAPAGAGKTSAKSAGDKTPLVE